MRVRADFRLRTTSIAASGLLALSACSKDARSVPIVGSDAAADTPDASSDAAAADGGSGQPNDAATSYGADAAQEDDAGKSEPFDPVQDCQVVADKSEHRAPVWFGDEAGFAIAAGTTGFGVAFQSDKCGAISLLPVAALGDYPEPSVLFDGCTTVSQGVSLLHGSDGYRLRWVDNFAGSAELQGLTLLDTLKPPANITRTRITNNQLRELSPVMARIGNTDYLSWISLDAAAHTRALLLQAADDSGEGRALIDAAAGYAPTRLALGQLGQTAGALAFVSEQTQPGIWLLPLDEQALPRGAPVKLSGAVSAGNSVDLATREEDGGAVIYSVDLGERHEVRFRRLSAQGAFMSDEVKVVTYPLDGRDASLARLGGGYVVAFRAATDPAAARGEIQLSFVTKEGNLQRDSAGRVTTYPIAEASMTGGRVSARISRDGQLLVGFLDVGDSGPEFRLIRKRLDCAL